MDARELILLLSWQQNVGSSSRRNNIKKNKKDYLFLRLSLRKEGEGRKDAGRDQLHLLHKKGFSSQVCRAGKATNASTHNGS